MAKRKITADNGAEVKAPEYPKSEVNEFDRLMSFMIDQISERFRNQTFKKLNKKTTKKFESEERFQDAQTGNFARVFLKLTRVVKRKILRQFDDERVSKITKQVLNKLDKRNRDLLYKRIEKRTGVSTSELTSAEALKPHTNALILETEQWVKKLRDDTLEMYTNNSLRAMAEGKSLEDIMEQFDGMVEKRRNHVRQVARTQTSTFNSLLTKTRARNIGVEEAIWKTSRDERVRPCHEVRHNRKFKLSKGLYSSCDGKWLLPGVDHNCRCDYELVIPEPEPEQGD